MCQIINNEYCKTHQADTFLCQHCGQVTCGKEYGKLDGKNSCEACRAAAAKNDPTPAPASPNQIVDPQGMYIFITAGNATFTLVSKETGQRYTYRIRAAKQEPNDNSVPPLFVSLLAGPDNQSDYTYLGMIRPVSGKYDVTKFRTTKASQHMAKAKPFLALRWFLEGVIRPGLHNRLSRVEFWHEGRCGRCGRPLTVPESIATGIGPVCAGAM